MFEREDGWESPERFFGLTAGNDGFYVDEETIQLIRGIISDRSYSGQWVTFTDIFGAHCEVLKSSITAHWELTPETRRRGVIHKARLRAEEKDAKLSAGLFDEE